MAEASASQGIASEYGLIEIKDLHIISVDTICNVKPKITEKQEGKTRESTTRRYVQITLQVSIFC